jgi:YgiT-type zinc finger domain-containing protein
MKNDVRCPFCNGKTVTKYRDINFDAGKIVIKNEPYQSCQKCKQDFCTNEQLVSLDKRLHEQFKLKNKKSNIAKRPKNVI